MIFHPTQCFEGSFTRCSHQRSQNHHHPLRHQHNFPIPSAVTYHAAVPPPVALALELGFY